MTSIIDLYKFVMNNMLEKKKRVFLTISGIIIGIFTFTFFIFVSQGLSNAISDQFTSMGVNILAVTPVGGGGGPPTDGGLTDTHIAKIKQVTRGYKYIAPFIFYSGQYEYGREKEVVTTLGYPDEFWPDLVEDLNLDIAQGRFFKNGDKGSVLLGAKFAENGFGGEKEIKVGSSIKNGDMSFRVIGILEEKGDLLVDNVMLMPFDDIKDLSGQTSYSGIRVSLFEGVDASVVQDAILRKLNPNNEQKNVQITSPAQAIEQLNQIIGVLQLIISFVSIIALIVGGVNVMNTMYSNILERINEISVMKALGATNADIRNMFLLESSFLGIVGALIGFLLSFILAKILGVVIGNLGYNVPIYFSFIFLIEVVVVTAFFTILCGTYPAIRAAMVDAGDNLRDE